MQKALLVAEDNRHPPRRDDRVRRRGCRRRDEVQRRRCVRMDRERRARRSRHTGRGTL